MATTADSHDVPARPSEDAENGASPATRLRRSRGTLAVQLLLPLAVTAWIASSYAHTWYVYDEWSVIDYTSLHRGLSGVWFDFNGHLWVLSYLVYKLQTGVWGLSGHAFVWTVFCASLLGWALATWWLLRELRVPSWVAVVAATATVLGGYAGQDLLFEVQFSPNTAFALGLAAGALVLRWPTVRGSLAAALMLTVAIGCDSAVALLLIAYVLVLVAGARGLRSPSLAPLLVPAVLGGLYFLTASAGQTYKAPLHQSLKFAGLLVADSAGAPFAGLARTGSIVLVLYVAAFAITWTRRALTRLTLANLVAGATATTIAVVSLTLTRAAVGGGDPIANNRYLGQVGVLVMVTALPVCCSLVSGQSRTAALPFDLTVVAVLLVAFTLNAHTFTTFRTGFEGWNLTVKKQVASVACPAAPDARPIPVLSPQISGRLLNQLQASHALVRKGKGCSR